MNETLVVLLAWASHLSGIPAPDSPPVIEYRPHEFFVENACLKKECKAVGWYNDKGVVYIDERYKDDDGAFASSLIVHEFTHYLQHATGKYDSDSCADSIWREREAYAVQQRYLNQTTGSIRIVTSAMIPSVCRSS